MNRGGPPAPQGQGPKRERRWQTSQERARVAAELIEEAESLTQTGAIASPKDVVRDQQPPPIRLVQPQSTPAPQARLGGEDEPTQAPSPQQPPTPPSSTVSPEPPPAAPASDAPLYLAAREASER